MAGDTDAEFPCALYVVSAPLAPRPSLPTCLCFQLAKKKNPHRRTLDVPFPTARLASVALKAIAVDKELSPLVRRTFSTVAVPANDTQGAEESVLRIEYKATTNRMLRVATNSFMDGLSLVLEVMEILDVDVLEESRKGE